MATRSLDIVIGAKDATGPALAQVDARFKAFNDKLKSQFGEDSNFGKAMKALTGAGAVAGLTVAGRVINDVSKQAESLALAFQKGDEATEEAYGNLLKSLPIVGPMGEGFRRIFDVAEGTAAEIARINQQTANIDLVTTSWKRGLDAVQGTYKGIKKIIDDIDTQMSMRGLSAFGREVAQAGKAAEGRQQSIGEIASTARDKIVEKNAAALTDLKKQLNAIAVPDRQSLTTPGDEFGRGGQTFNNDKEIADAVQQRAQLAAQIKQIEEQQARDIDAINRNAGTGVMKVWGKTFIAVGLDAKDRIIGAFQAIEKGLADSLARQRAAWKAQADAIIESIMTPAEKMQKKLDELWKLKRAGLITDDQMQKAIAEGGPEFGPPEPAKAASNGVRNPSFQESRLSSGFAAAQLALQSAGTSLPQKAEPIKTIPNAADERGNQLLAQMLAALIAIASKNNQPPPIFSWEPPTR